MNKAKTTLAAALALILISAIFGNSTLASIVGWAANEPEKTKAVPDNGQALNQKKILVGYYPAWASYSGYTPDKLDTGKLTHINYAFAKVGKDLKITMGYPDQDPVNFKLLNNLKKKEPGAEDPDLGGRVDLVGQVFRCCSY